MDLSMDSVSLDYKALGYFVSDLLYDLPVCILPSSPPLLSLREPFLFSCGVGDQTQGYDHDGQALSPLSYTPKPWALHFLLGFVNWFPMPFRLIITENSYFILKVKNEFSEVTDK